MLAVVGCRKGVMIPHLLKTRPKCLLEVDISDEMIRFGKEQWGESLYIRFYCGDILEEQLPILDSGAGSGIGRSRISF